MKLSDCCDAPLYEESDMCTDCKEHCGSYEDDEQILILAEIENERVECEQFNG